MTQVKNWFCNYKKKLKAKVNVVGLVPSTENLIGPSAIKPGDVYVARNGKSVEVFNTDAEGRLILGDALAYGTELKPRAMFDAATLTGAILIALGNTHTGVFTRDRELMTRIQGAADQTGELVWPMPLVDFHVGPGNTPQRETVLEPGEVIVSVTIPAAALGGGDNYGTEDLTSQRMPMEWWG